MRQAEAVKARAEAEAQRKMVASMPQGMKNQYYQGKRDDAKANAAAYSAVQKEYFAWQKANRGMKGVGEDLNGSLGRVFDDLSGGFGSMVDELSGLGAVPPVQGSKAWWVWYATVYLPQYYNQQQALSILQRNPLYNVYGLPSQYQQYQYPQTVYPYGSSNYTYQQYNNPYYGQYQQPYYAQPAFSQPYNYQTQYPGYNYFGGSTGVVQCNQQGGTYDAVTGACSVNTNYYNQYSSSIPSVTGQSKWQAVATLNAAGWTVWLLNEDGIPQGVPQDYNPRRVQITVANGVVTGEQVG